MNGKWLGMQKEKKKQGRRDKRQQGQIFKQAIGIYKGMENNTHIHTHIYTNIPFM